LSRIPLIGKLFQNRSADKASREVAVFVTAHLVPEGTQVGSTRPFEMGPAPVVPSEQPLPADQDEFRRQLEESMRNNR
jgi:type II secretory pathway component GspD/PulD (secretin)